jgi:CubicO group peptidase (beta-lactamase class C family)
MNYSTVADLWGKDAEQLTIRNLGKMMSGIPDFDTAKGEGPLSSDKLRADMYKNPDHFFGPLEILSLPWVYVGSLQPVGGHSYSSTNFMLLGLILAELAGYPSWENYTQLNGMPASFTSAVPDLAFGVSGAPQDYTSVRGYDLTSYNGHNPLIPLDIANIDGVFSGWTASDLVGPPRDVAQLLYSIYGPDSALLPADLQEFMVPQSNESFYGFATFNLSSRTGLRQPEGAAYGHLGATYGYQSIGAYFPGTEFALAVATNLETNHQSQPAMALCKAFNMVRAFQAGQPIPTCTYNSGGYYSGGCNCTVP